MAQCQLWNTNSHIAPLSLTRHKSLKVRQISRPPALVCNWFQAPPVRARARYARASRLIVVRTIKSREHPSEGSEGSGFGRSETARRDLAIIRGKNWWQSMASLRGALRNCVFWRNSDVKGSNTSRQRVSRDREWRSAIRSNHQNLNLIESAQTPRFRSKRFRSLRS